MSEQNDLMIEILKELRDDMKDVKEDIGEIKVQDAEQNAQLREHIRRSEAAELRLDKLEDVIIPEIVKKLTPKPLLTKINITWGVVTLSTIVGIIAKVKGWI